VFDFKSCQHAGADVVKCCEQIMVDMAKIALNARNRTRENKYKITTIIVYTHC